MIKQRARMSGVHLALVWSTSAGSNDVTRKLPLRARGKRNGRDGVLIKDLQHSPESGGRGQREGGKGKGKGKDWQRCGGKGSRTRKQHPTG